MKFRITVDMYVVVCTFAIIYNLGINLYHKKALLCLQVRGTHNY